MRDRLIATGFSAPVVGCAAASGAAGLLAGLAGYDAEDGELEIAAWLAERTPQQAAVELLDAAPRPHRARAAPRSRSSTALVSR